MLKASAPRRMLASRAMERAGDKGTIVDEKDQKNLAGGEIAFRPFDEVRAIWYCSYSLSMYRLCLLWPM